MPKNNIDIITSSLKCTELYLLFIVGEMCKRSFWENILLTDLRVWCFQVLATWNRQQCWRHSLPVNGPVITHKLRKPPKIVRLIYLFAPCIRSKSDWNEKIVVKLYIHVTSVYLGLCSITIVVYIHCSNRSQCRRLTQNPIFLKRRKPKQRSVYLYPTVEIFLQIERNYANITARIKRRIE